MNRRFFSIYVFLVLMAFCFVQLKTFAHDNLSVTSPDAKIVFQCKLDEKGSLSYSVNFAGQPIVLSSPLGLEGWRHSFVLERVERKEKDISWKPVYGERSTVKDKYKEASFVLQCQS